MDSPLHDLIIRTFALLAGLPHKRNLAPGLDCIGHISVGWNGEKRMPLSKTSTSWLMRLVCRMQNCSPHSMRRAA